MTTKINLSKIAAAIACAVLVFIAIRLLFATSEFSPLVRLFFLAVVPILAGLGAASKVGNGPKE